MIWIKRQPALCCLNLSGRRRVNLKVPHPNNSASVKQSSLQGTGQVGAVPS